MGGTNAILGWLGVSGDWRLLSHHRGRNFLRTAITRLVVRRDRKYVAEIIACYPRPFTSVIFASAGQSMDKHTVTIAVKAIAFSDGVAVRIED
jgi:hypothetical protein